VPGDLTTRGRPVHARSGDPPDTGEAIEAEGLRLLELIAPDASARNVELVE
jgi:hypothetical protein